ncbi:MAG TPA: hypothetical protein VGX25_00980 [Actinophytocola sp.]|uniref:hypothetical protein n=1 Tax=Actinophytocola sp. TaxID=1872138 RepID=UPI002DDD2D42|nr:hypothetical protein [Actinophytocola sp.]HEV2777950.1 hypothetical protein [Actinophytocola sp.]
MGSSTSPAAPETAESAGRAGNGVRRLLPVAVMLAAVGFVAALPLIRNHIFYFWDDTAVVGVPMWRRMASEVLSGHFPLLELDMWRGGNFAAEAAVGMWNPIALALAVLTYPIDNMALAITIVKAFFMFILAGGSYLLARDYGVRPWLAAAMGAALPFTGYTFFMDAVNWVNGLMVTAFVPWLWWTARRAMRRDRSVVWVVVAGYLCCSLGPYGLLATGVIMFGVLVEAWLTGHARRIVPIALSGIAIGLLNLMVYVPLQKTVSVGYRADQTTMNNEFLSPSISDLMGMSTPAFQPYVWAFGVDHFRLPAIFLAWFVLPLLPWLKWGLVRRRWRSLLTVFVTGVVFLLLVLGPSNVWLFRWPMRLVVYLWFPVMLLWVVLANEGLAHTRARARALASAAIILFGAYLAWSDLPENDLRIAAGAVLVGVLTALVVWRGLTTRAGALVLLAGVVAVGAFHVYLYPRNLQTEAYNLPTSQQLIKQRFAKYQGVTVQLVHAPLLRSAGADHPGAGYRDFLLGGMYSAAGVESLTGYGGLGYTKMDNTLCMIFEGSTTCKEAWARLWERPPGYSVPLADLIRAQTIVVQNSLIDTRFQPAPDGWRRDTAAEESGLATVWKRIDPLPFPGGRVSNVSAGVVVDADQMTGRVDERINYTRTTASGPASLTFARLAWPGYSATVDGRPAPVRSGPSGLLVVDLPEGVTGGELELTWQPPSTPLLVASFAIGLLLTAGLGIWPVLSRRRRRRGDAEPAEGPPPPGADRPQPEPIAVG